MFSTSRNPDGMQPVNPLPPRYRWARLDSLDWWTARYDRPLERSACVACPFQSRQRWVKTKRRWPGCSPRRGGPNGDFQVVVQHGTANRPRT